MAEPPMSSPVQRYLLLADEPLRLRDVLGQLGGDIAVLDKIGPPDAPHTAVVSMTPAQADSLAQRFRNLKIEPDQPLSPYARDSRRPVNMKGTSMAKTSESGAQDNPENSPSKPDGGAAASASSSTSAAGPSGRSAGQGLGPQSTAGQGSTGGVNAGADESGARTGGGPAGRTIGRRKGQYLIAARRTQGLQGFALAPLQFNLIEQTLRSSPDIEVIDTIGPKNVVGALADGMGETPNVLVVRMPEQKAVILQQQSAGRLIVERDQHLSLSDPAFQFPGLVVGAVPASGPALDVSIVVVGKDGAPVADAEVYLFGSLLPGRGITDATGKASLSLIGETVQSIQSLYVKPRADYWSFFQLQPDISVSEPNVVGLRPLADWQGLSNFPQQQLFTWGQKAMRLDQLPQHYRGQGVRIAVIDSGAATSHTDLNQIHFGFDVINKRANPNGWTDDIVAHGSHCAGVIAGADNGRGVRGFAPDAEIHVCKLFPGGQVSQLIDALEYCIEKQIDIVNLSLGGAEPSEALEQQLQRARRAGIACIVAAGNSGGPVQYPASSPHVLAVSAIGKLNEFPEDSYHTQTLTSQIDANGFFAARFSCHGPQIAVCGPGVAITSSVPSNNYAVWDGTSMAAPHITGLAALVLAHHPDFQTAFKMRTADRVERLFQLIKLSARPVNLGDPQRTGLGLPDVLVALGMQPRAQAFGMSQLNTLGAALGNAVPAAGLMQAFGFSPGQQQWAPNPWNQAGHAQGMLDPGYASLLQSLGLQSQMGMNFPNFPFGMAGAGFGLVGW